MRAGVGVVWILLASGCGGIVGGGGDPSAHSSARGPGSNDAGANAEDASGAAPASNRGASCRPVIAASYDRSCAVDSDCFAVGQVETCPASVCDFCDIAVVGRGGYAQYLADLDADRASLPGGQGCGCPASVVPCCRGGSCTASCAPPEDTLPECADAGGVCALEGTSTSRTLPSSSACANTDEVCYIGPPR
jgi:hypothetical protein